MPDLSAERSTARSGWCVVRITRTAVDDKTYDGVIAATEAKLALPAPGPGVEYGVAHVSYPVAPSIHYIVAWSGGYEQPSYSYHDSLDLALDQAREWIDVAKLDEGDVIDVLRVDSIKGTIERLYDDTSIGEAPA